MALPRADQSSARAMRWLVGSDGGRFSWGAEGRGGIAAVKARPGHVGGGRAGRRKWKGKAQQAAGGRIHMWAGVRRLSGSAGRHDVSRDRVPSAHTHTHTQYIHARTCSCCRLRKRDAATYWNRLTRMATPGAIGHSCFSFFFLLCLCLCGRTRVWMGVDGCACGLGRCSRHPPRTSKGPGRDAAGRHSHTLTHTHTRRDSGKGKVPPPHHLPNLISLVHRPSPPPTHIFPRPTATPPPTPSSPLPSLCSRRRYLWQKTKKNRTTTPAQDIHSMRPCPASPRPPSQQRLMRRWF